MKTWLTFDGFCNTKCPIMPGKCRFSKLFPANTEMDMYYAPTKGCPLFEASCRMLKRIDGRPRKQRGREMSERKCPVCGGEMKDNGAGFRCGSYECQNISTIPYHFTTYADRLAAENERYRKVCMELQGAIDKIDEAMMDPKVVVEHTKDVGGPVSNYCVDYDHDAVVARVKKMSAENAALRKRVEELEKEKNQ